MVSFPALEQPLNPFPHYEVMRRSDPVFQDPESGVWHVFGYGDVQRVLSDHATFSSRFSGDNPSETGQLFAASLINTDPPRHRQLRSLVTQAFTPRAVEALAPRIAALTEGLLEPVVPAGSTDLIEAAGVSAPGDRDRGTDGHPCRGPGPVQAMVRRDREPTPDGDEDRSPAQPGNGRVLPGDDRGTAAPAGQGLDQQPPRGRDRRAETQRMELLGFCSLLLVAGNETTTNLIGNAVLCFTEPPGTAERLAAEPAAASPGDRRGAPLPLPRPVHVPGRRRRHRAARPADSGGLADRGLDRLGKPRRAAVPAPGRVRRRPLAEPPPRLWAGHPLLPRRTAGAARGKDRAAGRPLPACRGWRWNPGRGWSGWTARSSTG